jgi:hypothetical protein
MALIYSLNYVRQYVLRLVSCVVAYWIFRHVFIGSNLGYVKMRFSPFMYMGKFVNVVEGKLFLL